MPRKSPDVILLFLLLLTRVQIDVLADQAALPDRLTDVRRLVEGWWPAWSLDILAHPQIDPVSTIYFVTAFGLMAIYFLVDMFSHSEMKQWAYWSKLLLLYAIIGLMVGGKTGLLINLRHLRGPASYAHDGGVIQTEVTIDYFLNGQNPYIETYLDTPMAEWGINEYRTALYHYPYLPWTFISATPFYLASQAIFGWFDMRMIYVILFGLTLFLAQSLVDKRRHKLLIVALIGLNPISNLSIIFGQNDPFVFFWIILAVWLYQRGQRNDQRMMTYLGSAAFGLACASKPTAWFLAPFWLLYLLRNEWGNSLIPTMSTWLTQLKLSLQRAWPVPVIALLIIGPWFMWSPYDMYDDVWLWSSGQGEHGYQIWGWGASNYALAFGWVESRFDYWPFIIPSAIVGLPLLYLLLKRQVQYNRPDTMLYGYAIFLFIFFYLSRFMQPNYLGYIFDLLVLAYFINVTDYSMLETKPMSPSLK